MNFDTYLINDETFLENRIPRYTKHFMEEASRYLNNFNEIDEVAIFVSMLLSLYCEDARIMSLFKKYGLEINLKEYTTENCTKKLLYSNIKYFRIPNVDSEEYIILTPIKIIKYYLDTYKDTISILTNYGIKDYVGFKYEFDQLVKSEEKRLISELSNSYFKYMPSETISYLDVVGKIYIKLLENDNINVIGYSEDSFKTTAYFLALFLFNNPNKDLNYKETTISFFNSYGLSLEKILKILNIDLKDIDKINPTLILKNHFQNHSNSSSETIKYIFQSQIINNSERNVVINSILNACNIDYGIINNLYKLFEEMIQSDNKKSRSEYNLDLKPDIILYLENSYRIHNLIVPKMGMQKIDGKIIQSIDDYIIIAFLINSYYRKGKLSQFFLDNGITIDSIYELIGFKVDFEKLNSIVEINDKSLIINFYKYLDLSGKSVDKVTIDDIEKTIMSYNNTKTKVLNRIFYDKTKQQLPDKFLDKVKEHFLIKQKKESTEIIESFFHDVDTNVYKYLKEVSVIYKDIKDKISPTKNAQVISLLLATKYLKFYKNGLLYDYLSSIELKADEIALYSKLSPLSSSVFDQIYPKYLETDFTDFVFGGYNEMKKREEITIESILANALNKKLCDSFQITLLLEKLGLDYSSLENLEDKVFEFEHARREKEATDKINSVRNNCEAWYTCLTEAYLVLDVLKANNNHLTFSTNEDSLILLSLLIGFLKMGGSYKKYFENHGITLSYVLNTVNCPIEQIMSMPKCKINNINLYSKYSKLINNLYKRFEIEYQKSEYDISYIGRRLFDASIFSSDIIQKVINDSEVYNAIKQGITKEKIVVVKLTVEQTLEQLEEQVKHKPKIDTLNIDAILEFILEGDKGLSNYSEYIQLQIKEINKSMNVDKSLESIDEMVGEIYVDTPLKQNFLAKLFISKNNADNIQREVNTDVLSKLIEEIDTHIDTLAIQIRKYREIFKVISLYLAAIKNYYDVSMGIYDLLKEKRSELDKSHDNYSEILNIQQALDGITDKINGYERTTTLMRQQQFQIYQTIVNHLISRNALQTSKDDIIPIISSEMLFSISSSSSRNALELSNNLIGLFKNVIQQNVNGAKANLEVLKTSDLPQEAVDKIIADVSSYIDEVDKNREEILKLSSETNNDEEELNNNEKVKKIGKKN